eukprot:230-Pleurochrysis_carterae.AAC.1
MQTRLCGSQKSIGVIATRMHACLDCRGRDAPIQINSEDFGEYMDTRAHSDATSSKHKAQLCKFRGCSSSVAEQERATDSFHLAIE